jgi:hypothetical protein
VKFPGPTPLLARQANYPRAVVDSFLDRFRTAQNVIAQTQQLVQQRVAGFKSFVYFQGFGHHLPAAIALTAQMGQFRRQPGHYQRSL